MLSMSTGGNCRAMRFGPAITIAVAAAATTPTQTTLAATGLRELVAGTGKPTPAASMT
jgi:hypothetical protein